MSEDIHIIQLVSDYLDGYLQPEEKLKFETQVLENPELAAMLDSERIARRVVIGYEALKLKDQMKMDLTKPKSNAKYWAGLALLTILSGGLYWRYISETSTNKSASEEKTISGATLKIQDTSLISRNVPTQTKTSARLNISKDETLKIPVPTSKKQPVEISTPAELTQVNETKTQLDLHEIVKKDALENVCLNFNIISKYTVVASCKDKSTGELRIKMESIKSGIAPYSFSLDGKVFQNNHFNNLKKGSFMLYVKDAMNCISKQEISIPAINCDQVKEYSFNPTYDQSWTIPYDENKKAMLMRITDKGGQDVFRVSVSDGSPSEWHGESNTGLAVGIGYHLFFIEYTDGTVDKGAITILQ